MKYLALLFVLITILLSSCRNHSARVNADLSDSAQVNIDRVDSTQVDAARPDSMQVPTLSNDSTKASEGQITEDMAFQGVNQYCHDRYDWSVAEENPTMMYVQMGEETNKEYQVVFRSYTGAFVYFYVDKSSGTTRMVEYVPNLDVKNDVGTIDLFDYLKK